MHKKINGWVNNSDDGVHIEFNANKEIAESFYQELISNPPKLATITNHSFKPIHSRSFTKFEIIASDNHNSPSLPLTPDFALCEDCRNEIDDNSDRRYQYAFTTCTNCGPRYSIITELPYDRPGTTMAEFEQCDVCSNEYHNPLNRRHFSQTNSCPDCGIKMSLDDGNIINNLSEVVKLLNQGKIIAIKGIGGFLLMCDASNSDAINNLRQRKNRPSKPFAVMYPSLAKIKEDFEVRSHEVEWFNNEVSPIVLLKPKSSKLSIDLGSIAPGLNRVGCMVPYAPLFHLLLKHYNKPLVATSGNISGSPIIYKNEEAIEELSPIADAIIANNRDIIIPQDDSVLSFSQIHQHKIILRRSRGLAPTFLDHGFDLSDNTILAVGAQMKSSFTYTNKGLVYISQYLGDMDNYLTQEYYKRTVHHFMGVFQSKPKVIIGDKHPDYFTTGMARDMAGSLNTTFFQVQHHKAHFYAVLAENKLLDANKPILGVIWDGTGYGDDDQIWGGEFFLYENYKMNRVSQLPYFPFILGNKMPREPRISALSVCSLSEGNLNILKDKFTSSEWDIYTRLLDNPSLFTSSMGRLFDAIASIALDIDKTSYEGEAAMILEAAASNYFETKTVDKNLSYTLPQSEKDNFITSLVKQILDDKINNISTNEIAAKFHISLVNLIRHEAEEQEVNKIAFSGGVFQNALLLDLITTLLQDDFELVFHQRLSANDENISYGQLAWFSTHEKLNNEVPS